MNMRQKIRRTVVWACLTLVLSQTSIALAERLPWEIDPYRTLISVDVDPSCYADQAFLNGLLEEIQRQRYATSGAIQTTEARAAAVPLTRWYANDASADDFIAKLDRLGIGPEEFDRIQMVSLRRDGDWEVTFREFDTLTRSWGGTHQVRVLQRKLLPAAILRLSYEKFMPVAKITDVQKPAVALTIKATTLIEEETQFRQKRINESLVFGPPPEEIDWKQMPSTVSADSFSPGVVPGTVNVGEAMQPVLRRNDRQGNLIPANGIAFMPWTYISCEANDGLQIKGTMVSGYGQPLPGRRNVRTQRLAIGIRPVHESTELKLVDKATEAVPLAGYEIYSKDPDGPTLVGASDANGNVAIPQDPRSAVRLLYVRSGGNLLARLPVVPGHEAATTARITNDSPRLLAEGFVEGWRDQLVDVMARRQILAQRVSRKIEQGEFDDAEKWLDQLRAGRTVNELAFELRSAKGQFLKDNKLDPTIKRRIDDLFEKGQRLVAQDKSLLVEGKLAKELEEAKKAQP